MNTSPRRRWFRFSLRTMFVLVTLVAATIGWLGREWRIVQVRKAILREIERLEPAAIDPSVEQQESRNSDPLYDPRQWDSIRVSTIRRLLGDESVIELLLPRASDRLLIERTENAFPEADLAFWDEHFRYHSRDSLYLPAGKRRKNMGTIFTTGLIEKSSEGQGKP